MEKPQKSKEKKQIDIVEEKVDTTEIIEEPESDTSENSRESDIENVEESFPLQDNFW
jgi:hypothetical protein